MLRFTRISLGKSPVGRIQAQSEANVRRKKEEAGVRVSKEETAEGLAAELRLQHVNDGVLLGDDLSLPGQSDGHEAHGKNAERERQAHLCFRSGYTEYTTHPGHKGSQEQQIEQAQVREQSVGQPAERFRTHITVLFQEVIALSGFQNRRALTQSANYGTNCPFSFQSLKRLGLSLVVAHAGSLAAAEGSYICRPLKEPPPRARQAANCGRQRGTVPRIRRARRSQC